MQWIWSHYGSKRTSTQFLVNARLAKLGVRSECPKSTLPLVTHRGDEAVERLSSLCVLDGDGTQVVAEPDGGDDPARVAVSHVLLLGAIKPQ